MNKVIPVITIDGPSGVGKSTLSLKIANSLKWNILNSGIIYRVLAGIALSEEIDFNDELKLKMLISDIKINFVKKINQCGILCNNKKVKKDIYTETIGNFASKIAMLSTVRDVLLTYQRTYRVFPGLVADGRDMGTIVFPNAIVKIFLYASLKARKQRRLEQLQKTNFNVNFKGMLSKIQERDHRDYNRKIAPLKPAIDALVLNTTSLSANEVENRVFIHIRKKLI